MNNWNKEYPESNDEKLVWLETEKYFDIGYCDFNIDDETKREWWIQTINNPIKIPLMWTELPEKPH